jgi:hypothetical protein
MLGPVTLIFSVQASLPNIIQSTKWCINETDERANRKTEGIVMEKTCGDVFENYPLKDSIRFRLSKDTSCFHSLFPGESWNDSLLQAKALPFQIPTFSKFTAIFSTHSTLH